MMFKKAGVVFFYTLTPLHPGSGVSVGAVDLPIQRERHTNFPIVQASGVKGALRDLAEKLNDEGRLGSDKNEIKKKIEAVFGPETSKASEHGGALALTDARVLLFPVRSVRGVFAWITCPEVIAHLKRDLEILSSTNGSKLSLEALENVAEIGVRPQQAYVPPENNLELKDKKCVILEEFRFEVVDGNQNKIQKLAEWLAKETLPSGLDHWRKKLKKDLVLLNNEDFSHFVETATEVITRVKLGEKGTVEAGPWDEEHLPAETLLYSLALATEPKAPDKGIADARRVLSFLSCVLGKVSVMQFGGDETVGKGLVKVRYLGDESLKEVEKEGPCQGEPRKVP